MKGIVAGTFALMTPFLMSGAEPAARPEDDLTVVKRALAQTPPAPAADSRDRLVPATPSRKTEPQWLRIRVVDKGSRKAKVSVNLPLALVHALGDEWPVDLRCGHKKESGRRCSLRLAEVFRSLDAGQELFEVDDGDQTVRIWVE